MNRTEAREKATALVAQMTIEEAASQLLHSSPAIPRLGIPAYDWWIPAGEEARRPTEKIPYLPLPLAVPLWKDYRPKETVT